MKVVKIILKKYKLFITGVLLGSIITGGGVYASTVGASNVSYSNSSSGLSATNTQGAIDSLYQVADTKLTKLKRLYCGEYFYRIAGSSCSGFSSGMYSSCMSGCTNESACKSSAEKNYGDVHSYCVYNVLKNYCSGYSYASGYDSCVNGTY